MQEFKINEFITLKLEKEKTVIYVADEEFAQCKFLLLNIPTDEIESFDEIESIDEAAEKLDKSMERGRKKLDIPPETEFWGHCSNIQAWAENNYNTRLLHLNLAFPLLKKLTEAGDPLAKKVFKNEIAERFASGHKTVMTYLANRGYLSYFDKDELKTLFEGFEESPETLLEAASEFTLFALNALQAENPVSYIKKVIERIPLEKRANILYNIGKYIANVKLEPMPYDLGIQVKTSKESNIDLGIKILELALEFPNCPERLIELLTHLYGSKNRWDKAINVYEIGLEQKIVPMFITGIFMAAFYIGRQDIIDKYLEISLENREVLENAYSLSNVLYALNDKETKEASETALRLTKIYWNAIKVKLHNSGGLKVIVPGQAKHKMIPTLWINMTNTYVVADLIDETSEEIYTETLNQIEDMHPIIYENIAWYFLQKQQIDRALHYLKEAKLKGHPGFKDIKESKFFKSLRDNPEFISLFVD